MENRTAHIERALELAVQSAENGTGPFGAVVVKDGIVVAEGHNRVTEKNDPTAHAEVDAIRAACEKLGTHTLAGCDVYTSSYPCPMCFDALLWARVRHVYYANSIEVAAKAGFDDKVFYYRTCAPHESDDFITEMTVPGAGNAFAVWQGNADKIQY